MYTAIRSAAALRLFTEHHVVCVLDFMALLKSLQRDLACLTVPWVPSADPEGARLIQRIVLDEETDVRADGRVQSHFAWYLEAMEELGADVGPARGLVRALEGGAPFDAALRDSALPAPAVAFGRATAALLERPLHERAAAFFHGREEILPELFLALLERLAREGLPCATLRAYLERHVEVDGGDHGPLGARLLARLIGGDPERERGAAAAAQRALEARLALWDAIAAAAD